MLTRPDLAWDLARGLTAMPRAVFLDRDGVLIEDVDLLVREHQIQLLPGVPAALQQLKAAGFRLVVVSNQTVVARGLATELDVRRLQAAVAQAIVARGGPDLDGFYFCPHHPNATLPAYRIDCPCRKPRPGLLRQAALDGQLELSASFMVGDRLTDVAAGKRAGCRTIWLRTGQHLAPLIQTAEPLEPNLVPNFTCDTLAAAARWIHEAP